MAVTGTLKKGIINAYTKTTSGPSPAKIYIEIDYEPKYAFLKAYKGFKEVPQGGVSIKDQLKSFFKNMVSFSFSAETTAIRFELPVMPETIKEDFGSGTDNSNVVQIGEIVKPKYAKAKQWRWESIFPYDTTAPYINTTVRSSGFMGMANAVASAVTNIGDIAKMVPTPDVYKYIFEEHNKKQKPFRFSMNFYSGGNIPWQQVTLGTYQDEPENNGDYKYDISLNEWVDISPVQIDENGNILAPVGPDGSFSIKASVVGGIIQVAQGGVGNLGPASLISMWWNMAKSIYGIASRNLVFLMSSFNGVQNYLYYNKKGNITWTINSDFSARYKQMSIHEPLLDKSDTATTDVDTGITSDDTVAVGKALKELSFNTATEQMKQLFESLRK